MGTRSAWALRHAHGGLSYLHARAPRRGDGGGAVHVVLLHGAGDNEEGLVGVGEWLAERCDFGAFVRMGEECHAGFLGRHRLAAEAEAEDGGEGSVEIYSLRAPVPFDAGVEGAYRWFNGYSAQPAPTAPGEQAAALRALHAFLVSDVLLAHGPWRREAERLSGAALPPGVLQAWALSRLRSRCVLVGFSQGASMAWQAGYYFGYRAAVMSGRLMPWVVPAEQPANVARLCEAPPGGAGLEGALTQPLAPEALAAAMAPDTPAHVFVTHGLGDPMTPARCADESVAQARVAFGARLAVAQARFRGGHTISAEGLHGVQRWVEAACAEEEGRPSTT